jgi:cytochrome b561
MKQDAHEAPSNTSPVMAAPPRELYHWSLVFLHWLVVALVVVQYVTSPAMLRVHRPRQIFTRPDPFAVLQHTIHIRVGLLIIVLMAIRFALRWRFGVPQPVGGTTSWQARGVQALHFSLYAIIFAQGIIGAVAIYFWWPISAAHVVLFKILLGLVILHVAAGLWHQFFLKDGALRRIVGI